MEIESSGAGLSHSDELLRYERQAVLLDSVLTPPLVASHPPLFRVPAIVLVGGYGSRMKHDGPKHLIPVTRDQCALDFPMMVLAQSGISRITFSCVNATVDAFRRHASRAGGIYDFVQFNVLDEPRGIIPALRAPIEEIKLDQEPVIVIHGDEVISVDLVAMYKQHVALRSPVTVCVANNEEAVNKVFFNYDRGSRRINRLGMYKQDTPLSEARIVGYTHTMAGLWIIQPEAIGVLITAPDSHAFIARCFELGDLFAYPTDHFFLNLNTMKQIAVARNRLNKINT